MQSFSMSRQESRGNAREERRSGFEGGGHQRGFGTSRHLGYDVPQIFLFQSGGRQVPAEVSFPEIIGKRVLTQW